MEEKTQDKLGRLTKLESSLKNLKRYIYLLSMMILGVGITSHFQLWMPQPKQVTELSFEDNSIGDDADVKDGVHLPSGLIAKGEFLSVVQNCLGCHSAKLVTQNRMSKEGWKKTIKWMQETQNLWDLGENESKIVNYLATYYAPKDEGRRKQLSVEEWYTIE